MQQPIPHQNEDAIATRTNGYFPRTKPALFRPSTLYIYLVAVLLAARQKLAGEQETLCFPAQNGFRVLDIAEPIRPASGRKESRPKMSAQAHNARRQGHHPFIYACGSRPPRAYRPDRRRGRVAEGGGLLNRYRLVKAYRGFESLRLRQFA